MSVIYYFFVFAFGILSSVLYNKYNTKWIIKPIITLGDVCAFLMGLNTGLTITYFNLDIVLSIVIYTFGYFFAVYLSFKHNQKDIDDRYNNI